MITTILNCYKRPQYLKSQIDAIRSQSVASEDILIWYNKPEDTHQYDLSSLGCKTITCNHNFKFHGRFALGLLAQTEYVAFFDDDTIPGENWYKNCLDSMETKPGIYGTTGVVLHSNAYDPNHKVGWNGIRSNDIEQVDLVGHAWFMKRSDLLYLWREYPYSWENGEDMQLSFLAQKHGNVSTYVPPHPVDDTSIWGSIKGEEYGNDISASWRKNTHSPLRNEIASTLIENGWSTVQS